MPFNQPPPTYTPVMIEHNGQEIFNPIWARWLADLAATLAKGVDGTITTASLGGATGSMTFVSGVLVAQTPAT